MDTDVNSNQPTTPSPSEAPNAAYPQEPIPSSSNHSEQNINEEDDGHLYIEREPSEPPETRGSLLSADAGRTTNGVQNLLPVLYSLQRTSEKVLHQTLKFNDVRAPLTTSLTTFMSSLNKFMIDMARVVESTAIPDDLYQEFRRLDGDFSNILGNDYQDFRTANDEYEQQENPIVQDLWRSSRYFDNVLQPNTNEPAVQSKSHTITPSQGPENVLLEDTLHSPALLQFFSQTGDVEAVREKIFDLHFEHEQILSDKASREELGLSLDEDSLVFLESFDMLNQALSDELHAAEATLDSLRRWLTDDEIYTISGGHPLRSPSDGEVTLEDETSLLDLESQAYHGTDPSEPAYPQLPREPKPVWGYLDPLQTTPIDPTEFINAWMLNELQSSPQRWKEFTYSLRENAQWKELISSLGESARELDARRLDLLINMTWFKDIPPSELAQRRRFADQQSMEQNEADSHFNVPRSAAMVVAAPRSLPLLKLSSTVTANEILERARQARSLKYYSD
ncbi:hypothetical protein LTR84_002982 [Exophiala bonariae]|uniref:Uncharacterized protein n=1 Tax=Exophiala bonariae TaxID=1690606 RepID=A0AAV9NC48_9EURO|nr:hypothetical protein LTR84_002982 [Exophiala bonariae]